MAGSFMYRSKCNGAISLGTPLPILCAASTCDSAPVLSAVLFDISCLWQSFQSKEAHEMRVRFGPFLNRPIHVPPQRHLQLGAFFVCRSLLSSCNRLEGDWRAPEVRISRLAIFAVKPWDIDPGSRMFVPWFWM